MKTRHLLTVALAALSLYLLAPGCTQDFGAFKTCEFGAKPCGGECVAVNDPEFGCSADGCDPCGIPNAVGKCKGITCEIGTCAEGFENCDGAMENGCEAEIAADPQHCGACDTACLPQHATPACDSGACSFGTCDPGWADCNGDKKDGCEMDTEHSPANCGACGTQCPALEMCVAGECTLVCPAGKGDCNNNPVDGCETSFGTTLDCAFCGDACDLPNAAASCIGDKCVVENCQNGFGDCDNLPANGCEADLQNSAMTCGTCNNMCPSGANGTAICDLGVCAFNCNSGFDNCDNNLGNGCETDLATSNTDCGACGQACTIANGNGSCVGGVCTVMMCNGAFKDCDMNAGNGCEANTNTSTQNCGMCGVMCSFANAAASCQAGACQMGACNMGFGNCNNMASDGCEKQTSNDPLNCGTCGNACPNRPNATTTCTNGTCGFTCDVGFGNCDGQADNGCEANTATSVVNCGGCGRACSGNNVASRSCTNGLCDSTCDLGFGNCTMPAAPTNDNGCETNTAQGGNGTSQNCGSCGNDCSMQGGTNNKMECDQSTQNGQSYCGCSTDAECASGGFGLCNNGVCLCGAGQACVLGESCGAGNQCQCNGGAACGAGQTCCVSPAGCKDLQTDAASCGACGHACPPGFACAAGGCVCDGDADCNAGTAGTCAAAPGNGRCTCGATQCQAGERCQPNGQCG